jgi:hypothetical protein
MLTCILAKPQDFDYSTRIQVVPESTNEPEQAVPKQGEIVGSLEIPGEVVPRFTPPDPVRSERLVFRQRKQRHGGGAFGIRKATR